MSRSLRIVVGSLGVGGTELHLTEVLPRLVRAGWTVRVRTLTQPGPLAPTLEAAGVPVTPPPGSGLLARLPRRLRRPAMLLAAITGLWLDFLRDRRSLTHFFLPEAYLIGGSSALLAGLRAPCLMSRRSLNLYQQRYPLAASAERWLHRRMAMVMGNSLAVITQLRDEGVPLERLRLIYNGIDTARFNVSWPRTRPRRLLGLDESSLVMIIVANLIPYKGHSDLLSALGRIADRLPQPWRLLCVGKDAGILDQLRTQAKQLGIAESVLWLGERRDVAALLSAADIGLLISHEEGFSNAVLEGMAAGLPMIVTAVGGNPEAVEHGVNGLVVPPKNPEMLAQALLNLASCPELREQFGLNGRERVERLFSIESCVRQYEKIYGRLLVMDQV